jgi:hypothetical protein
MNSGASTYSDQLRIRNTNFGNADIGVGSGVMALATDMSNITFYTSSSLGTTGSALPTNERMRIDGSGNVGIGTNDPGSFGKLASVGTNTSTALLAVRDQGTSTGNLFIVSTNSAGTIARINANGIGLGGATPSSGMGITFPATQSASSDANTLDDYEEGTWTPAIQGSTTAGTASYSNNAGRYTKIGRQVFVEAFIDWFSGTGTGNLRIGNLPFTATNDDFYRPGISIGQLNNVTLTASNIATAWIDKNTSFIAMQQYPVGGGAATDVAYDIAGRISFGAVYTI